MQPTTLAFHVAFPCFSSALACAAPIVRPCRPSAPPRPLWSLQAHLHLSSPPRHFSSQLLYQRPLALESAPSSPRFAPLHHAPRTCPPSSPSHLPSPTAWPRPQHVMAYQGGPGANSYGDPHAPVCPLFTPIHPRAPLTPPAPIRGPPRRGGSWTLAPPLKPYRHTTGALRRPSRRLRPRPAPAVDLQPDRDLRLRCPSDTVCPTVALWLRRLLGHWRLRPFHRVWRTAQGHFALRAE